MFTFYFAHPYLTGKGHGRIAPSGSQFRQLSLMYFMPASARLPDLIATQWHRDRGATEPVHFPLNFSLTENFVLVVFVTVS